MDTIEKDITEILYNLRRIRRLAEFFDIDLDAANKERELLLKSLQEHKQGEMEMYYEQEN